MELPENPYSIEFEGERRAGFNEGQQSMIDAGYRKVPSVEELLNILLEFLDYGELNRTIKEAAQELHSRLTRRIEDVQTQRTNQRDVVL